jgi:hypothetical protein
MGRADQEALGTVSHLFGCLVGGDCGGDAGKEGRNKRCPQLHTFQKDKDKAALRIQ